MRTIPNTASMGAPSPYVYFPTTGSSARGRAALLAIDDASLPIRRNLCQYLSTPDERPEPVLFPRRDAPDAPDNMACHFYGTVLHDEGRFRMWYYACHWGKNPDYTGRMAQQLANYDLNLVMGPICYAESDDGIEWTRPNLGQVLFKGNRDNNIIDLPHPLIGGATLIRDDDDPDPSRRYKLVYEFYPGWADPPIPEWGTVPTVATAVSPDGIHWSDVRIPFPGQFVEQSSFYRHNGLYIINYQVIGNCHRGEGGSVVGRSGVARCSYDFDNWSDGFVESFMLPEPRDPERRGADDEYDQVHLGVGAASLGNVCVGLYGLWHNAKFVGEFNKISCDFGLVVSNDGLRFREPVKGHVFLNRHDAPATPRPDVESNTVLCQANGILNVGDETRIYHGRWLNNSHNEGDFENYSAEVALATLPRDRWGALGLYPDQREGAVWSAAIRLPDQGCAITLNAEGAQDMRVELADERFNLLQEWSGDNSGVTTDGDGLDCTVTWPGQSPRKLGGHTIRVRVSMQKSGQANPRLYAVYVDC